ncbi:MAG: C40 family peptidase, partial [Sciscionella sp.]
TGESKKDFLERASALDVLAADNNEALHRLGSATNKATSAKNQAQDAKQRATTATTAANKLIDDLRKQNKALQAKIGQVKAALAKLSPADQSILSNPGDSGVYIAPAGAAGVAMDAALGERGAAYVWGADGPSSYDCSGLMMYAYGRAGISLPHSAEAQSTMGRSVSRDALQPGDLVFFGSPVHHVGMYVGDGMMVDASTEGVPVRVEPLQSDYAGARRLAG